MRAQIGRSITKLLLSLLLAATLFGVFAPPTPVYAGNLSISSKTPAG